MEDVSIDQMISDPEIQGVQEPAAEISQEVSPASNAAEYEYTVNGKTIKEPIDAILKRASQGYNYAQHMEGLNKEKATLDERYNKAVQLESKYGEIDKFATENPDWNEHLQNTWQSRFDVTGGSVQSTETAAIPPHLSQKINELESFVSDMKAREADNAYSQAMSKTKEQYPDIDFMATDPDSGKTLEQQVLDFASHNQIGRFEPAFKAFYHDKLIERTRLQAKEQFAADLQQRTKAGFIGKGQVPARSIADSRQMPNIKSMNYNDIERFIIDNELN